MKVSKNGFGFLEIIIVLLLLSIITWIFIPNINNQSYKSKLAAQRLVLYLQQTRYKAMMNNQFDANDSLWHKKRWTLKFMHCSDENDGLYYTIYSDTNKTGQVAKNETLKDPLTKKYVYSNNRCLNTKDRSSYVLLTKEYGINDVKISCNETSTIGQLSFGYDGQLYSKLSSYENDAYSYQVVNQCNLELISEEKRHTIVIEGRTGYVYLM